MSTKRPIDSEHQYRATWRWPADIEQAIAAHVADGYCLHVCCGKSPIGDVRVDADPPGAADVRAEMSQLPFEDETFDYVVWDPPWKVPYFDRFAPFYELVRVTAVGGQIIVNATWLCESDQTEIVEDIVVRADNPWRNISAITVHERVDRQAELADFWGTETDAVPTRPRPNRWARCHNCGTQVHTTAAVHSAHLDPSAFCSPACCHEAETALGTPLTPTEEPTEYVPPGVWSVWQDEV